MSLERYRRETIMILKNIKRLYLFILLFLAVPSFVMAGEATERIKVISDNLFSIISDKSLQTPEMEEKREQMIMEAVDRGFHWEEFSKRALARHWNKRTEDEKKVFISLFRQLIERTYMDKSGQYSGGKVEFLEEKIDGEYANIKTRLISPAGTQTPVDYRMIKKDGVWWVYDVYIEGVSLVSNYRTQFNDILIKSSFEELLKRLEEKIEKGE
jgi:phospholipid transport system substrate-binding protein